MRGLTFCSTKVAVKTTWIPMNESGKNCDMDDAVYLK